ncbi:hypothetical protein VitviT2T_017594 [Vitis vinifera]|uniref:GDSL esterase/lipase n=2 Tax=Vitis vinifera TaxID=29760 RepID=A0ABY9CVB4_VITVI|nr:hypothetical protein VitviT2T_017594 [Vitis vinifera]
MNISTSSNYKTIFSFGDSLADTGNHLTYGREAILAIDKSPYGITYFHRPTGRCSDGRLVVDFIAEAFGVPELPPYLATVEGQNLRHGVNFAVAGATALDTSFFYERGLDAFLWTNSSLSIQLGWFKKLKPSICKQATDCTKFLRKSLFLVGEIGGNDYNFAFLMGQTIEDVKKIVHRVVRAIVEATKTLIKEGAVNLVIPGNFPVGCLTVYQSLFQSRNKEDYDSHNKCLVAYNHFSQYHNRRLKAALIKLQRQLTHANIIYVDYYNIAMPFFNSPEKFGFIKDHVLLACCGGGEAYNLNLSAMCGKPGSKACM